MHKSDEQLAYEDEQRLARLYDQEQNQDYSRHEDGSIERCEDCGGRINSRGHCPNCDY